MFNSKFSVSANAATTTTTTTVSAYYIGCMKDNDGGKRDLPNRLSESNWGLQNCASLASSKNYLYFGLQNGNECWAANSFGSQGVATNCNKQCSRDSNMCGGAGANSVYSLSGLIV